MKAQATGLGDFFLRDSASSLAPSSYLDSLHPFLTKSQYFHPYAKLFPSQLFFLMQLFHFSGTVTFL